MPNCTALPKLVSGRRRRFQRGSLQRRQSAGGLQWIAFWWQDGRRRGQVLGPCLTMTRPQALVEMAKRVQPVNDHADFTDPDDPPIARNWTVGDWIRDAFLPFIRRRWKLSTASTSGDRIRKHLQSDLGSLGLQGITREFLQQYLEQKAAQGLSFSVVDHLRWDLRAIFRLACQDRQIATNPAEMLFTPPTVARPSRRVLAPTQAQAILEALDLREQLIVHLALFSGMRPGEILALQWKHVEDDHVRVLHRLYRGKLDRPKSQRSKRHVALSSSTRRLFEVWRERSAPIHLDAWVFPSARIQTSLRRDNLWRRWILPRLEPIGFEWATFQIMRRTHASLSREAGIDPKLVADQLGHGLGVNLDVYTVAALHQRQKAVETLETTILRP